MAHELHHVWKNLGGAVLLGVGENPPLILQGGARLLNEVYAVRYTNVIRRELGLNEKYLRRSVQGLDIGTY